MAGRSSKIVSVAIGVLVREAGDEGRVLIARRLDGAVYGGYWEFPGGKVDEGESPAECLAREFREELGIEVEVGESLDVIEHVYEHAHVRLHPFYCVLKSGEPNNLQVAEHRWVSPAELAGYQFPEANEKLIARVMVDLE